MRHWPVLLTVALLLASCEPVAPPPAAPAQPTTAPARTPEPAADGGTLRYAIAEPGAIVPVQAAEQDELAVVDSLFDSLTRWAPSSAGAVTDLDVKPAAASRWSSEDALTWTFQLRRRATYHDGTPVTAADFKFAWELAVTLDEVGYHLRDVEGYEALRDGEADGLSGVRAVDERTLEVRLASPQAEFPAVVGHPALGPLPRGLWQADPEGFREQPVGNGPFAMSEPWARGQFVRVSPYEGWRNRIRRPSVTEVVFQVFDPDTAYLAFQQGRLDFTLLPPGALEDAEEHFGASADGYTGPGVLRGDAPTLYYLAFNVRQRPFDDVEVRRALSLAIDRDGLAETLLGGNVSAARSLTPPVLAGARPDSCLACRHDPDTAREIFAQRDITSLTLWINDGGGHDRVARRIRRDLLRVGVRLQIETADFDAYLDAVETGTAGWFRSGWRVDYPTVDNALYPILHTSSAGDAEVAHNQGGYGAADVDALLDRARATLDRDERHELYGQAEELALNRDQALVPLFTYRHSAVASDRVGGLVYDPMALVELVDVEIGEAGSG